MRWRMAAHVVSLAMATASSSVLNVRTESTGPKISSFQIFASLSFTSKIV